MSLSFRAHCARPFIASRDYDGDRASTLQLGFTTYRPLDDGDQSYQVSYLEWGGRSDHLDDALSNLMGHEVPVRRVSEASASDRRYVGSNERNGIEAPKLQTVDVEADASATEGAAA